MPVITSPDPASNMNPSWGEAQLDARAWFEPLIVVSAMILSCYITRRRNFPILPPNSKVTQGLLDQEPDEDKHENSSDSDTFDSPDSFDQQDPFLLSIDESGASTSNAPKKRNCCGLVVRTPNSSRYANYWHSRFLQKFPFLVEMFYWAVNYVAYLSAKAMGELLFATEGVWDISQKHSISILYFEQDSIFSFLFPLKEVDVQHFFMNGHQDLLTVLNRSYSLVHIPATVSFIAWYYHAAPTHDHFAAVRRMMTLTNFVSFFTFTAFPCMPPRLLPKEYGFFDTVRHDDAESVWANGKFFNQLAAFPSLHFGYAFCAGVTFIYHSGLFRRRLARREKRMNKFWQAFFFTIGILYPAFVLTIIVATANHYWTDALAAAVVVAISWMGNRIFLVLLPLEDMFLYMTKLEKPIPTTGRRS